MVYIILGVLGLAMGSFLHATVWRLHKKQDFVRSRSECEHCKHVLDPLDLIPVVSWALLRGRCRYCHRAISWLHPAVELLTAALFIGSYHYWPTVIHADFRTIMPFAVWLSLLTGLIAVAIYDLRWLIIPDKVIYPLIGLIVARIIVEAALLGGGPMAIKDAVLGLLIGGGLFYLVFVLSDGKWIGGGDVKLGILLGLTLGGRDAFIALYAASIAGALAVVVLLGLKKVTRKSKVPFGPFLIGGIIVGRLFGATIWHWYQSKIS